MDISVLKNKCADSFRESFDAEGGGYGPAPRFLKPHNIIFLLRQAYITGDNELRDQAAAVLRQMYRGGIFDHIGGGFFRFSYDIEWLRCSEEKTLFDNALMALVYTEAWQNGHFALYRDIAERTLDFCIRDLLCPGGAFCGGVKEDVCLTPEAVCSALGDTEGKHFSECYDITAEGNSSGRSIPNLLLNDRWYMVPEGYTAHRKALYEARRKKQPLLRDTSGPVSWNGLMLAALAAAGRCFKNQRYTDLASNLCGWLETAEKITLDDCVFTALGFLEMYSADFDPRHVSAAVSLADEIISRFYDEKGGFYMTESEISGFGRRPKILQDGAMPSGNSAAVLLFERLYYLTGVEGWRGLCENELEYIFSDEKTAPHEAAFALCAEDGRTVIAVYEEEPPALLHAINEKYMPGTELLLKSGIWAQALEEISPIALKCRENGIYLFAEGKLNKL